MAFRGFKYYFGEALKSIWYNKIMAATSIITVTGCLLLFGFFLAIVSNINSITRQIEAQCEVQAFINMDYTNEQAAGVLEKVSALPNIKTAVLETKEEAFLNWKEMLGEGAVALEGLDPETFLPSSCRITLTDIREIDTLVDALRAIEGIDDVVNHRDLIGTIITVTSGIRKICVAATIILALIAVFIISNTIKLDVHARKKEIHIMKYVGATDWFIRWPFIIEGMIVGIIGSVISILIISLIYSSVTISLSSYFGIFKLISVGSMLPAIMGVLLCFGVLIGALGSLIAVRKHLHV